MQSPFASAACRRTTGRDFFIMGVHGGTVPVAGSAGSCGPRISISDQAVHAHHSPRSRIIPARFWPNSTSNLNQISTKQIQSQRRNVRPFPGKNPPVDLHRSTQVPAPFGYPPSPVLAIIACNNVLAPAAQDSLEVFSASLWLTPPSQGMKIIDVGATVEI